VTSSPPDGEPTDDGLFDVEVHLTPDDLRAQLADDVRRGLGRDPKSIPPVWFYDEEGSRLFELITELPEYYPTRAERTLLERSAADIAEQAEADTLVELGAGACSKTRILLDAMSEHGGLRRYVPFDVSDDFLRSAASQLVLDYPGLQVLAVIGDFHQHLGKIPAEGRRLVAFLGGTVGNLDPDQRRVFYGDLRSTMDADDRLLLGTDLVKATGRIVAAYDDAAGVTAAFNKNVLAVLNHQLGADFDLEAFDHVARWNDQEQWIEMRLRSTVDQQVRVEGLDLNVPFGQGEELLTEISAKFTADRVRQELAASGFRVEGTWGAEEGEFLLTLARPV
jgi:L-histidine N-alpha-methyltransferase